MKLHEDAILADLTSALRREAPASLRSQLVAHGFGVAGTVLFGPGITVLVHPLRLVGDLPPGELARPAPALILARLGPARRADLRALAESGAPITPLVVAGISLDDEGAPGLRALYVSVAWTDACDERSIHEPNLPAIARQLLDKTPAEAPAGAPNDPRAWPLSRFATGDGWRAQLRIIDEPLAARWLLGARWAPITKPTEVKA